jgi:hypothetical protein
MGRIAGRGRCIINDICFANAVCRGFLYRFLGWFFCTICTNRINLGFCPGFFLVLIAIRPLCAGGDSAGLWTRRGRL